MPKRNVFRFGQSKAEAPPLWHFPSPVLAIRSIASFDSLTRFKRATPIATRIYPSAAWQTCCAFTRQQRPPFKNGLCTTPTFQLFNSSTFQLSLRPRLVPLIQPLLLLASIIRGHQPVDYVLAHVSPCLVGVERRSWA